jgi:hypothetical protein
MLWRYVIGGAGILLFLLAVYPALESEVLFLVLYAAGLISLFYGLLNSPPPPEPAWTPPARQKKERTDAAGRDYPSANPWFPVFLIGGAAIVLFIIGMLIIGIFLFTIETDGDDPYSGESVSYTWDRPVTPFYLEESGDVYYLTADETRVNLSETQYVLVGPDGFREHIGGVWVNMTPDRDLDIRSYWYRNRTFQLECELAEGDTVRFRYESGPADGDGCDDADRRAGTCTPHLPAGTVVTLVPATDGGALALVNGDATIRIPPPAVTDYQGRSRQFAYRIDPAAQTITLEGDTTGLEYPLYCTLPL